MARLPTPGADNNNWGDLLNGYLRVEHNDDGTHTKPYVESNTMNTFTKAQIGSIESANFSTSLTLDLNKSNRFKCILTDNISIINPLNLNPGQGGVIYLEQDSTGSRSINWSGSNWTLLNSDAPNLSPGKVNVYAYEVYSSTKVILSYVGSF